MQDNDLNIEDFKEIFLKAIFANYDLNSTSTIEEMADYFKLESFKFKRKNSDDSLSQRLKDLVFKEFINWIEKAKIEVSEPFIEHEYRHLDRRFKAQAQGLNVSEQEMPNKYNLSIPISAVSNRLGGKLELWVVDYIYQGFELFKQQHEEDSNATAPPTNTKPTKPQTGYDLGYTNTQLETLHTELIKGKFLDRNTDLEHFKNAFNGEVLAEGFEPLKWVNITKGAIFISYFLRAETKGLWKLTTHLMESADYSGLLYQSKGNETFHNTTTELKEIKSIVKKIIL